MKLIKFYTNSYSKTFVLIPKNKIRSIELRKMSGGDYVYVNDFQLLGYTIEEVLELINGEVIE